MYICIYTYIHIYIYILGDPKGDHHFDNLPYERSFILLIQSCAMDKRGRPVAFAAFGAAENQGIAFGGFLPQYRHTLVLDEGGIALGGVLSLLGLFA